MKRLPFDMFLKFMRSVKLPVWTKSSSELRFLKKKSTLIKQGFLVSFTGEKDEVPDSNSES